MKLPICDITPFTLQDFPDHTACILWFGGCNMRCAYCHNPQLVLGKKKRLDWKEIRQFLKERQNLLDGVVLSGGECTLTPDLPDFIKNLRKMGYKIKLDTNGLRPDVLDILLSNRQLDYVALDYKAPRNKFQRITGRSQFDTFRRSLEMLCAQDIPFEVRTTVHTGLMDESDVKAIMADLEQLNFRGNYYIQNFQPAPSTLQPLPEQLRKLDVQALPTPKAFAVQLRNF